jgi:uncharacterized UPF0146 family protein
MALNKIKPVIEEIEGVRCVVVESGIGASRAQFLTKLLTHNGYDVKSQTVNDTITLGVTDLLFNPVLDVYKRRLKSLTNHRVTPAYWLQLTTEETETEVNYWVKW